IRPIPPTENELREIFEMAVEQERQGGQLRPPLVSFRQIVVRPEPDPATAPPASDPAASVEPSPSDPGPTLAEGGGTPEPAEPTPAPATFPDNWREIMAGGDTTALKYFNRYANPANVGKALMATRQKISSGEMIAAKPDGTDEQALNEWRAQAGIPEKAEGYLDKLPDGIVIGDDDKPIVDSFITSMHEDDIPPAVVHKALTSYIVIAENIPM
ncbi:hypothetical protein LCGC14_3125540, partial [marine sediment metagenome]